MRYPILFLTVAAFVVLGTASRAQAWGAFHVGYTHVGAGGVEHYGYTAARGPYGAYAGGRSIYGTTGSAYHYGATTYSGYHPYTPVYTGGYALGGYHYAYGASAYRAGVFRRY